MSDRTSKSRKIGIFHLEPSSSGRVLHVVAVTPRLFLVLAIKTVKIMKRQVMIVLGRILHPILAGDEDEGQALSF